MVILGYILDVLAVPALALVGEHGWVAACMLLVIQRMGKAIKKPAKEMCIRDRYHILSYTSKGRSASVTAYDGGGNQIGYLELSCNENGDPLVDYVTFTDTGEIAPLHFTSVSYTHLDVYKRQVAFIQFSLR